VSAATRVLVVEDDDHLRDVLSAALAAAGYAVVSAPHGAAALELIAAAPPTLILLDVRLPVRDGLAFAEAYRRLPGPHAPILALSVARGPAAHAAPAQADGFLAEPSDLGEALRVSGRHAPAT
jgi:two-component system, chemotaxis family, chemotaxis protein CheY